MAFVHDLVREAAVATLPAHRRTLLHAAAATALLRRRDTLAAIHHVLNGFGALEPDDAVEAVARGCEQLAQRWAFEEMLAVATRLGEVVAADHRCGPRHEAAALLMASWAYQLLGDVPRHRETALAAGLRARADGAYVLLAEAALSRAGSGPAGDADPQTAELLDSTLALVPTDDLAQRSRLMGMRAFYLANYEGRGVEARSASLDALVVARQLGDPEVLADALSGRLFVLLAGNDVPEQIAAAEELRSLVARLPPTRTDEVLGGPPSQSRRRPAAAGRPQRVHGLPRRGPVVGHQHAQLAPVRRRHDVGWGRRPPRRRPRPRRTQRNGHRRSR